MLPMADYEVIRKAVLVQEMSPREVARQLRHGATWIEWRPGQANPGNLGEKGIVPSSRRHIRSSAPPAAGGHK